MSGAELATLCGQPLTTWGTWERERSMPRNLLEVVTAITNATGVDRDWLLWGGALLPRPDSNREPAGSLEVRYHGGIRRSA